MRTALVRRAIDTRVAPLKEHTGAVARPAGGWVNAIRTALGMTLQDLADRMDISRVAVHKLEASERHGTAQLNTLERAADAMGCDLVYAFIPRTTLEDFHNARAQDLAAESLRRLNTTMALEGQQVTVTAAEQQQQREAKAREIANQNGSIWRDTSRPRRTGGTM